MKSICFVVLSLAFSVFCSAKRRDQSVANPVGKVIQLLSDLQKKITKEGNAAKKTFEDFSEWCEDRSKTLAFDMKTATSEIGELQAGIEDGTAKLAAFSASIDEETSSVSTNEADLKAATAIRSKEAADFSAKEKELMEVISMLNRASTILEREMRKGGAAMVQVNRVPGVINALQAIVASAAFDTEDASKLMSFVQNGNDDADAAAPAAEVYTGHSGSILDTLADLSTKAAAQLENVRKAETTAKHNFEMLEQSLTDAIAVSTKEIEKANKAVAETSGRKSNQEADLAMTSKSLDEAKTSLRETEQDCMTKAQDHEAEKVARAEELSALAEAKKVIIEKSGGAEERVYSFSQISFMQLGRSQINSGADLANFEVVRFVRGLAQKQHSERLAQLARRMASAVQVANLGGDDPFAKVTKLISEMISRLEQEAGADATHKAYCDKEFGETKTKIDEKNAEIAKLSTKIDSDSARSVSLKDEIAALQGGLANLAKTQADMDALRQTEKTEFGEAKVDTENGIQGIKMALSILRDYYGGSGSVSDAKGAADSIIGLLEVVESDFTKMLAQLTTAESTAASEYDKTTKANQIEKATKESDVKYKTKEAKHLDAAVADASSDRSGVHDELSAILEYNGKLVKECTEVAGSYETRAARRAAEIEGLKEALTILENETTLLERGARRRTREPHGVIRAA